MTNDQSLEWNQLTTAQRELILSLPLLLNSSLESREIIKRAINALISALPVEAITVFKLEPKAKELVFWSIEGVGGAKLEGKRMPSDRGIVGWVVAEQQPLLVPDVSKDPRFFNVVDNESSFKTRDLICCPLTSRAKRKLGAIQLLNCKSPGGFSPMDLHLVMLLSNLISVALENALIYEELSAGKIALENLNRRKEEMLQIMCHEIRTPLAIIQSSAELLSKDMVKTKEARARVESALSAGIGRLSHLAGKIRDLTQLVEGRIQPQISIISLSDLVEELRQVVSEAFLDRKIKFEIALSPQATSCKADQTLLLAVLRELIVNAVRFTPDGGEIVLEITKSLEMINFTVRDNGIGIEAAELNLIFEKFYQVGKADHHTSGRYGFRSGGLGLGLSTVKSILLSHSSAVNVKSTPGKGSTFSFAIPA